MNRNQHMKLLLFDLDGTLLQSDKTLSARTISALNRCREKGILIGISTSRAIHNCMTLLPDIKPDLFIASGGAVIEYRGSYLYISEFSEAETRALIDSAREICGDCEIAIDTLDAYYRNYKINPNKKVANWGETTYSNFADFNKRSLKFSVETPDEAKADRLAARFPDYDFHRFVGTDWYKFSKKNATKEDAIRFASAALPLDLSDAAAFGDDVADIGMLKLCGTGVAMGNALDSVKEAADTVIGSNDEDGIAEYLEKFVL